MKGTAAEGRLGAKTGSRRRSSRSGYTTSGDGELLVFAMIMEISLFVL